jgi:hypothetical protein
MPPHNVYLDALNPSIQVWLMQREQKDETLVLCRFLFLPFALG